MSAAVSPNGSGWAGWTGWAVRLPEEFQEPVPYFDRWLWFALLAVFLVLVYYAVVLVLTRKPSVKQVGDTQWWRPFQPVDPQGKHLHEIDQIERETRAGTMDLRVAHQQLSETVRSYVATVTPLPARTMSLTDLKAAAPGELAAAIELMYPPEFAPDEEGEADKRFDAALHHARRLVSTWR